MTFPYPLTPEVRADLWRFMGLPPEAAATMTVPPVLPVLALIPRNGDEDTVYKLTDTPFARAFVAWREERAETERPLPPISTLAMDLLLHNKVTP